MNVLIAASECVPFIKTGGLADVVGTLPHALQKNGVNVSVILPNYHDIPEPFRGEMKHVVNFYVNLGWRRQRCDIETLTLNGISYYFVGNDFYFGGPGVYGSGNEEGERYAFFSRAVLEALPHIGKIDIIHCNDWQTALIPALLEIQYRNIAQYAEVKTVFTIHNLLFQGVFPLDWMEEMLGLPEEHLTPDCLEYYGKINFMKAGILFADRITTVSPTYAQEIQQPYRGETLHGVVHANAFKLRGILNGIDTESYHPNKDPYIQKKYTWRSLKRKEENKKQLQCELGLAQDDAPVIAVISRLTGQKGIDLIEYVLPDIMNAGVQFVVLGKGDAHYEDLFKWAKWRYGERMALRLELNEELAHRIYAGADMLLMPSEFEPCGLSQMIAMQYGTLPIVRETGGLKDTVKPYNEYTGEGNGFSFANFNAQEMLYVIYCAVQLFNDNKEAWASLMRQAMRTDCSWDKSAQQYKNLYCELVPCAQEEKEAQKGITN
ncbi:MAG: glycogen synthase GlgA [Christensenellales bacterium]